MTTVNKHRLNEQEYLQGELNSQIKHEFVAGEVFAMVGASASHNLISGNMFAELRSHLKGKPCRPYINDMKVKIAENFYTVWLDMKNNIEDSSIRQHNISNLINELKNFTYQARSDTIDAEKIIQNGYREIIDNEIDTIKKQMSQTELTMQNATNFIDYIPYLY